MLDTHPRHLGHEHVHSGLRHFIQCGDHSGTAIRYGARVLELAKGKFAVELASPAELLPTLELVKAAIESGELDAQLESTAGALKKAFNR